MDHEIDYTGTHYGWDLGAMVASGPAMRNDRFPTVAHACMNDPKDKKHHNTLAPRPWELVKLDVGYWGAYYRKKVSGDADFSRDFGLSQGQDVYLCRFHSECDDATKKKYWKDIDELSPGVEGKETPIKRLLTKLKDNGFAVELREHATMPSTSLIHGLKSNELKVFFPDLHLPERIPDQPALSVNAPQGQIPYVHLNTTAREQLQVRLVAMQHKPGWAQFNSMSTTDQSKIQEHIEKLIVGGESVDSKVKYDRAGPWNSEYTYTREQFLAELAHVERRIRAGSCWFYEPTGKYTPPVKSGLKSLADLVTMDETELDPSTAIDLINLLLEVRQLRADGYAVKVYQVGDLFELWMGREFLYFDFPTIDAPLSGLAAKMMRTVSSREKLGSLKDLGIGDDFQYRKDAGWRTSTDVDISKGCKQFVFNEIRQDLLLQRHKSGWHFQRDGTLNTKKFYEAIGNEWVMNHALDETWKATIDSKKYEQLGKGVIGRLQALHHQRVQNVLNHCLPSKNAKPHGWEKLQANEFMNEFRRTGDRLILDDEHAWSTPYRVKQDEYYFNAAIVWLLDTLDAQYIHGNHDGYRSDPIFASHSFGYDAKEYISEEGVWIEHSHRYDRYNRDGRAIGAGMTNLVYYFMDELLKSDKTAADWAGWGPLPYSQERTSFQPGAAQWFALVNLADGNHTGLKPIQSRNIKNFGLYVGGHTHGPDLVRIRFSDP